MLALQSPASNASLEQKQPPLASTDQVPVVTLRLDTTLHETLENDTSALGTNNPNENSNLSNEMKTVSTHSQNNLFKPISCFKACHGLTTALLKRTPASSNFSENPHLSVLEPPPRAITMPARRVKCPLPEVSQLPLLTSKHSRTRQTVTVITNPLNSFKRFYSFSFFLKCLLIFLLLTFHVRLVKAQTKAVCPNIPSNAPVYPYDALNYNCTTVMSGITYNFTNMITFANSVSRTALDTVNPPRVWCLFNFSLSNNNYFSDAPNCTLILSTNYANSITYSSVFTASKNIDLPGLWCLYSNGANPLSSFTNLFYGLPSALQYTSYLLFIFHLNFDRFGYVCASNWPTPSQIIPNSITFVFYYFTWNTYGTNFALLNSPRIAPSIDFSAGFCNQYVSGTCSIYYNDPPSYGIYYVTNSYIYVGLSIKTPSNINYIMTWINLATPSFSFNPGPNYIGVLLYYVTTNDYISIATFNNRWPSYPLSGYGNIGYNTAIKLGFTAAANQLLTDPLVQLYSSIQAGNYCSVKIQLLNCSLNVSAQNNLALAYADSPISFPDILRLIYGAPQFLLDGSSVISTLVSKYSLNYCASTSVSTTCPTPTQTFAACPQVTTTCTPKPGSTLFIYTPSGTIPSEFPPAIISTVSAPWPSNYGDFVPLNSFMYPEIAHKYLATVSGSGYGDGVYKVYSNHEYMGQFTGGAIGAVGAFMKNNVSGPNQFIMYKNVDFFIYWNGGDYPGNYFGLLQTSNFDLYVEIPILIFLTSYTIQQCYASGCYGTNDWFTTWTIYASNNSINWNLIDFRSGITFTTTNFVYAYPVTTIYAFNVFKFTSPYLAQNSRTAVTQLRYFGMPASLSRIVPPLCGC